MQRVLSAVRTDEPGRDFLYFNGLPTAELTGLAYRGIGITLYSSAAFAFAPEIALAFHRALTSGDDTTVNRLIDGFYRPLVEPRSQGRGYAVSLVKAGVRLRGYDVGEVRTPLSEPRPAHIKELTEIIERGYALLEQQTPGDAEQGEHARAAAFLYPWDVVGDPDAPARVVDLGVRQVTLAAAYHSTRALTPATRATASSPPNTPPCSTRRTTTAGRTPSCARTPPATGPRRRLRRGRRRARRRRTRRAHLGRPRAQLPPGR